MIQYLHSGDIFYTFPCLVIIVTISYLINNLNNNQIFHYHNISAVIRFKFVIYDLYLETIEIIYLLLFAFALRI